jgi:regulator of replication initiation timing
MSQSLFDKDPFVDSEELMNWLLLNPELDLFGPNLQGNLSSSFNQLSNDIAVDFTSENIIPIQEFEEVSDDITNFRSSTLSDSGTSFGGKIKRENITRKEPSPRDDPGRKSSKKRIRESVDDLESRVKELKAENAELRAHLLNVTQRTTEVQKQRVAMERLMASKLFEVENNNSSDQTELAEIVRQYTDLYADYGKCRQREVRFRSFYPSV